MVQVKIKWNKQQFDDVELTVGEGALEVLQAQIYTLTNVPFDRQKILLRGKMMKADGDLDKVKEKATIVVMGTAEVLKEPPKKVVFEEDLTDDQKYQITGENGGGLHNLGNTCYMNAGLQMLRNCPEFADSLQTYASYTPPPEEEQQAAAAAPSPTRMEHELAASMGNLFKEQKTSSDPVIPQRFISIFRMLFPMFAERDEKSGSFKQQDAHESLNELMVALSRRLTNVPGNLKAEGATNWIDHLFQGQITQTTTCNETTLDAPRMTTTAFRQLSCNIDMTVNYMHQGLKLSFTEELEMRSPTLGRSALHTRVNKISVLPKYLVVQFVRFYWKKEVNQQCKMLRKVKYAHKFDIMDMCDDELKKKLLGARRVLMADTDKALGISNKKKGDSKDGKDGKKEGKDKDGNASKKAKSGGEEGKAEAAMEDDEPDPELQSGPFDVSSTGTSGNYVLHGIVTHQGRNSSGGHYVGWVRKDEKNWVKYDDDKVTEVTADAALDLAGGGDWHMTYLAMFKRDDDMVARNERMAKEENEAEKKEKGEVTKEVA